MTELKAAALPQYTPSQPSPIYSCQPSDGERTLQETPRHSRAVPNGTFTRRSGKTTVTLYEQESDKHTPVYGRNGEISGSIFIEEPHKVSQITLKIEGKLDTIVPSGGSMSISVLNYSCVLWHSGDIGELSSHLLFSRLLPSKFTYESSEHDFPPTYSVCQAGFHLRAAYSITICVGRARRAINLLSRSDKVKIPFEYHPRTRPHHPTILNYSFFFTLKASPEEWYQTSSVVQTRRDMGLDTVYCDLFIPRARVYGLANEIPFHVQLNGCLDALKMLMPQPAHAPLSSSRFHKKCPLQTPRLKITVSLFRKSRIETKGEKSFSNTFIGKGEIWELPLGIQESSNMIHLDWEGEVKPNPDVTVGGFTAGNVCVKDFVVLNLEPPPVDNEPSPFLPVQITVPIRLVTDSFAEVTDYEPPPV